MASGYINLTASADPVTDVHPMSTKQTKVTVTLTADPPVGPNDVVSSLPDNCTYDGADEPSGSLKYVCTVIPKTADASVSFNVTTYSSYGGFTAEDARFAGLKLAFQGIGA